MARFRPLTQELRNYLSFRVLLLDPATNFSKVIGIASLEATDAMETICLDESASRLLQLWIGGDFDLDAAADALLASVLNIRPSVGDEFDNPPRLIIHGDTLFISDSQPEVGPSMLASVRMSPQHSITIPRRTVVMSIHRWSAAVLFRPTVLEVGRSLSNLEASSLQSRVRWNHEGNIDMPVLDAHNGNITQYFVRSPEDDATLPSLDDLVSNFNKKDSSNG